MNGLGAGQTLTFLAYNPRTSLIGEVVVWGSTNGGSIGDSHGRFNKKNVAPSPGQWQTGDVFVPVDGSYCGKGKFQSNYISTSSLIGPEMSKPS